MPTSLAHLQEDKLQRLRRPPTKPTLFPTPPSRPNPTQNQITRLPLGTNFKRLPWGEMQARREKGLCNNCDGKFLSGHRCKVQHLYILETITNDDTESNDIEGTEIGDGVQPPKISLHAFSGIDSPHSMRVNRLTHGKKLHVLIDSDSIHNFVNGKFARKLGCKKEAASLFRVQVANGEWL